MPSKTSQFRDIKMTPFSKSVIAWIKKVPRGKVATYGQIARLAGKPGSSRAVGWILHACADTHALPWQRVLNSQGRISLPKKSTAFLEQKRLLKSEGIEVSATGSLDLAFYQWKKEPAKKRALRHNQPRMFS